MPIYTMKRRMDKNQAANGYEILSKESYSTGTAHQWCRKILGCLNGEENNSPSICHDPT